jgi:hypothetical protein
MSELSDAFASKFFFNEVNNLVGSGGEYLIKAKGSKSPATRIEVGDFFIGVGATHLVESMSRNPGPAAFRLAVGPAKSAYRAFEIKKKNKSDRGFDFEVGALSAQAYSALLETVSDGAVKIASDSIPHGTMILSFLDNRPTYTLDTTKGSPRANWEAAAKGERHWNVGVGKPDDFWVASLPSDDYSTLSQVPPWTKIGSIQFGLSLLSGSAGTLRLDPSPCVGPTGRTTTHDFCFSGNVVGKQGLDTPFPILMRTEITFRPKR